MSDTTEKPTKTTTKAARLQHVVAHRWREGDEKIYDQILVFGTKLEALEHCHGKGGWDYQALAHGQAFGAQA